MNLQQITEMAAKKLCATCGKTMAANHYWYKGGWRCKKSSLAGVEGAPASAVPPQAQAAVAPKVAPTQAASAPEPKKGPTVAVDVKKVREMIPELEWQEGDDDRGSDIWWQVSSHGGRVDVYWDYTFRRNTPGGAYEEKRRLIGAANSRLATLANTFSDSVISINLLTPERIRQIEARIEGNGDPLYSEYEQSIGGGITFKG